MALAPDSEILLLDEPTTFLDLAHQIEVLDLLLELNQTQGRTLVMVLHDLNQACRYADYLVAVKEGCVYAHGTPMQVMTEEMVREVSIWAGLSHRGRSRSRDTNVYSAGAETEDKPRGCLKGRSLYWKLRA